MTKPYCLSCGAFLNSQSRAMRWTKCFVCQPKEPPVHQYQKTGCKKHHFADWDDARSTCRICHRERQRKP